MIVSDKHRFILTLPQKCASGTLQLRLAEARDLEPYGGRDWHCKELRRTFSKHIAVRHIVRLRDFKKRRDYFRACFVRNPYDRIYSWFRWIGVSYEKRVNSGRVDKAREKVERGEDPDGVYENFLSGTSRIKADLEGCQGDFNRYLELPTRKFELNSAFTHHKRKLWVDFIGRVESFEEDYESFCRRVDVEIGSRQNDAKSGNPDMLPKPIPETLEEHRYLKHYQRSSIDLVNEMMAQDFELLGYRVM